MPVTPSGPYSIPLSKLRELVAASPTFQARVGADSAAAALRKVRGPVKDGEDLDALRPFAVVALGDDWDFDSNAGGARNEFAHTGGLTLYVTDKGRYEDSLEDEYDWGNFIGELIGDLCDLAAVDDNLVITNIRQTALEHSDRREDASRGFGVWAAAWTITYGDS